MILKFNGWQRLWLLVSSIYFVIVSVFVILNFPQPEKVPDEPAFVKKLSPQSRALLVQRGNEWRVVCIYDKTQAKVRLAEADVPFREDQEGWQNLEAEDADVVMPNGRSLSFKKGVSEKDMSIAAREYWALITATANERRWSLIGFAALWWIVPSIALYIFGKAIGWVYHGFRNE